jgi:DNA-binding LacI/PurR family transcriptional regulator
MKKITIKDIARIAGVSKSTVSKVMNNYPDIPEKTRKKILEIMKRYNYYPFESAQMFSKGRSTTIAFVTHRIAAQFTAGVLWGIEERALRKGKYIHDIIPYSARYDLQIKNELLKKILYARKASGVIMLAMNPDQKIINEYKKAGIPVVLIENKMKNAHSVNVNNRKGAYMATEYLIKKGRKRICLICGFYDKKRYYEYSYAALERKAGYEEALKHYGLKYDERYIEIAYNYTIEEGKELFSRFMKKGINPDGVLCASGDLTAMGVMDSAKEYGLKIPDDLSVIGFDDYFFAAYLNPSLTTVRQSLYDIGYNAYDLIVAAMEGKLKSYQHILIEPELIIRNSA